MAKRTYQLIREAVDRQQGTLSCNWCFKPKPADQVTTRLRANGRIGHICNSCKSKVTKGKK